MRILLDENLSERLSCTLAPRFGIQNTKSRITGYDADRTAESAAVAMLNNGLESWVKERLRRQRGNVSIRLTAVIVHFRSHE